MFKSNPFIKTECEKFMQEHLKLGQMLVKVNELSHPTYYLPVLNNNSETIKLYVTRWQNHQMRHT